MDSNHANTNFSDSLLEELLVTYQPYSAEQLTHKDAHEIATNLSRFALLMERWARTGTSGAKTETSAMGEGGVVMNKGKQPSASSTPKRIRVRPPREGEGKRKTKILNE